MQGGECKGLILHSGGVLLEGITQVGSKYMEKDEESMRRKDIPPAYRALKTG